MRDLITRLANRIRWRTITAETLNAAAVGDDAWLLIPQPWPRRDVQVRVDRDELYSFALSIVAGEPEAGNDA
jgi:hypothetical protein